MGGYYNNKAIIIIGVSIYAATSIPAISNAEAVKILGVIGRNESGPMFNGVKKFPKPLEALVTSKPNATLVLNPSPLVIPALVHNFRWGL